MAKLIISDKSRVWVLVAALIIALMATTATASAHYTDDLLVHVNCESGESKFTCYVAAEQKGNHLIYANNPVWETLTSNAAITRGKYEDTVWGVCNGGKAVRIRVTASYSGAGVVPAEQRFTCNPSYWP